MGPRADLNAVKKPQPGIQVPLPYLTARGLLTELSLFSKQNKQTRKPTDLLLHVAVRWSSSELFP
jgi:hypothetical protein